LFVAVHRTATVDNSSKFGDGSIIVIVKKKNFVFHMQGKALLLAAT
jgi:hypothetical protein